VPTSADAHHRMAICDARLGNVEGALKRPTPRWRSIRALPMRTTFGEVCCRARTDRRSGSCVATAVDIDPENAAIASAWRACSPLWADSTRRRSAPTRARAAAGESRRARGPWWLLAARVGRAPRSRNSSGRSAFDRTPTMCASIWRGPGGRRPRRRCPTRVRAGWRARPTRRGIFAPSARDRLRRTR
jgi:hypothetical protein